MDNVQLVLGIYEAMGQGNPGPLMEALDDKVEWNMAEHLIFWPGGPYIGADAVGPGVFGPLGATFGPSFRIEPDRVFAAGDTVIMQGRYKGTVLATGKDLDVQSCHIWDINDGKVVRFQQYTDTWAHAKTVDYTPAD